MHQAPAGRTLPCGDALAVSLNIGPSNGASGTFSDLDEQCALATGANRPHAPQNDTGIAQLARYRLRLCCKNISRYRNVLRQILSANLRGWEQRAARGIDNVAF